MEKSFYRKLPLDKNCPAVQNSQFAIRNSQFAIRNSRINFLYINFKHTRNFSLAEDSGLFVFKAIKPRSLELAAQLRAGPRRAMWKMAYKRIQPLKRVQGDGKAVILNATPRPYALATVV